MCSSFFVASAYQMNISNSTTPHCRNMKGFIGGKTFQDVLNRYAIRLFPTWWKLLGIILMVIFNHLISQFMEKLNLIYHILLIVVCIDKVSSDLDGLNNKLKYIVIATLGFTLLLQWYGVHTGAIVIVDAIY